MFYHIDSLMPCCKDSVKFLELSFVRVGKSYSQCYIIELDRLEKKYLWCDFFDILTIYKKGSYHFVKIIMFHLYYF